MRVGFVTIHELNPARAIPNAFGYQQNARSMFNAVAAQEIDLHEIGPLATRCRTRKLLNRVARWISGRNEIIQLEPAALRSYARQVETAAEERACDALLSPSSKAVAHLSPGIPVVLWRDATFQGALQFHRDFGNLSRRAIRLGNRMERMALERADLALFRSDWAARSAIEDYGIAAEKVRVVPTGGNLGPLPAGFDIEQVVRSRGTDCCRLLFIGVDWVSKGGETVLAVAEALQRDGVPTELIVVGCRAPVTPRSGLGVRMLGFIDSRTAAGRESLLKLMRSSHFLIVPSHRETYGNVFAEASAVGLPCIGSRAGGIPTVVRDGVNGMTFERSAAPAAYAGYIAALMADRAAYERLALSTHRFYRDRLDWRVAGATVRTLLGQVTGRREPLPAADPAAIFPR